MTDEQEVQKDEEEVSSRPLRDMTPVFQIGEAPITIHRPIYDKDGGWVAFTIRDIDPAFALSAYKEIMRSFLEKGYTTVPPKSPASMPSPPREPSGKPTAPLPPQSSAQKAQTPPAPSTEEQKGDSENGTDTLNSVTVNYNEITGSLQTSFSVGKFRYGFKDSRAPEVIAAMFDPELGWTPEHFSEPGHYDTPGLMADWYISRKGDKRYYNLKRIYSKE